MGGEDLLCRSPGQHHNPSTREWARSDLVPRVAYGADFPNLSVYECHPYRASDMLAPPRDHHVITVYLDDSPHLRQERAGVIETSAPRRGEAIVKPAGYDSRWHGEVPWHVRIALPADSLPPFQPASHLGPV